METLFKDLRYARAVDVLKMVLGQGMGVTLVGIGIGLGAASGLTRLLAGLLFEVSPTDVRTFSIVSVMSGVVAFLVVSSRRVGRRKSIPW